MVTAAKLVRALATLEGKGRWVYNDKLRDGGRSIKVYGAGKEFHEGVVAVLEAKGFRAKLVKTKYSPYWGREKRTYRVHVWEV